MTIDDERPEDELHDARASELLTIVALVFEDCGGKPRDGRIGCPICTGTIAYSVTLRGGTTPRRALRATCTTPGCIRYAS